MRQSYAYFVSRNGNKILGGMVHLATCAFTQTGSNPKKDTDTWLQTAHG